MKKSFVHVPFEQITSIQKYEWNQMRVVYQKEFQKVFYFAVKMQEYNLLYEWKPEHTLFKNKQATQLVNAMLYSHSKYDNAYIQHAHSIVVCTHTRGLKENIIVHNIIKLTIKFSANVTLNDLNRLRILSIDYNNKRHKHLKYLYLINQQINSNRKRKII